MCRSHEPDYLHLVFRCHACIDGLHALKFSAKEVPTGKPEETDKVITATIKGLDYLNSKVSLDDSWKLLTVRNDPFDKYELMTILKQVQDDIGDPDWRRKLEAWREDQTFPLVFFNRLRDMAQGCHEEQRGGCF